MTTLWDELRSEIRRCCDELDRRERDRIKPAGWADMNDAEFAQWLEDKYLEEAPESRPQYIEPEMKGRV